VYHAARADLAALPRRGREKKKKDKMHICKNTVNIELNLPLLGDFKWISS
jgi:hypothetical protein